MCIRQTGLHSPRLDLILSYPADAKGWRRIRRLKKAQTGTKTSKKAALDEAVQSTITIHTITEKDTFAGPSFDLLLPTERRCRPASCEKSFRRRGMVSSVQDNAKPNRGRTEVLAFPVISTKTSDIVPTFVEYNHMTRS